MDASRAALIFEAGQDAGADFVEIFVEESRSSHLMLKDQVIENAGAGTEYGIGVRLLFGTEVLYGYTSDDSVDALTRLVRSLSFGRKGLTVPYQSLTATPQSFQAYDAHTFKDPRVLGQGHKMSFLHRADEAARNVDSRIAQVGVSVIDTVSYIQILNSEGLSVQDRRARTRFSVNVTAGRGSERIGAHEAPGFLGGYEILDTLDVAALAQTCAQRALRMLEADYITGGQMPVVMGNGFGGVIFHEACGHPLETESVRRKASPFCDKVGELIAHPAVTAIDDGTLPGAWGSLAIDDEGMPVQRTVLIENGVLKGFLSDRVGAMETGVPRTASARRESYKYAPVSRMRNTFIAPGVDAFEDMVTSVEHGLFAAKMAGGSVNPATGEFNFAVEEGYVIRKGRIAEPVRGATLIGKGHEILPRISMVGSDFACAAGMCGASSGSVPVTVGQPSLKVDRILVGGR